MRYLELFFFFSSRRRHTRYIGDWSSDVCSSDLFRKDDAPLRNAVEEALECLKQEGTVARLHEKWFGFKPAAGAAAVTVYPGYGVPGLPGHDPKPHQPHCK